VKNVNIGKWKEKFHRTVESIICERKKDDGDDDLDTRLNERIKEITKH